MKMRRDDAKTTTYKVTADQLPFIIDIVETRDEFGAWLSRENYGIKEFMFGVSKASTSRSGFIDLVECNLTDYIELYAERYC